MTSLLEPRDVELAGPVTEHTVRVLPRAPVDAELSSYEHREVALLAGMSLISIVCLAVSQVRFVQIAGWLVLLLPALAFTIVYYLLSLITSIGSRNFDVAAHRRMVEEWAPAAYPSVDVLLPICNEGIDVLINTWTHVAEMADHYPGDVLVHVLDDGASAEAEVEAARFGFRYAVRPNRGWLKKSGNLHFGYETSNNTYLVVFDADFCPRPDFLNHLLPYLEDDPELGIVQSPQFFRSSPRQTVMERGAAAVQELFYRMIQVSRDSHGGAICVGSCAVYRRAALDTIGGTALIEHSEDVHTGFDLSRAGWRLRYVPVPLATGLCPEHPDAFLTQQYRWCAGSMSLVASRKFWSTRMPTMTRLCHLSGLCYYLHTAVFVFFAPAIPLVLIIAEPSHVQFANYVLILPSTFYAVVIFPLWNRIRYGPSALMAKYLYGWAHLFAILDIFTGRLRAWQATGSGTVNRDTRRIWIGICAWGVTASVAWVLGAAIRGLQYRPIDWLFMELFGLSYAFVLVMALRARRVSAQS